VILCNGLYNCKEEEARAIRAAVRTESGGIESVGAGGGGDGSDGGDGSANRSARDAAHARGTGATGRRNRRNASPARRGAAASAREPVSAVATAKSSH